MKVSKTKVTGSYTIYKKDLNRHNTLFGGQILYWLDDVMGMTIRRFTPTMMVTASIDSYQFLDAVELNELLTITSYVSHVGTKSAEVFSELTAFNPTSRKDRLIGLAFSTFAIRKDVKTFEPLENVEYEKELEKFVFETYNNRKENKLSMREFSKLYAEKFMEEKGE